MNTIIQSLNGKKTYLTCTLIGALLFGSWQGWWKIPPEIYAGLATLATAFLRAGLSRALAESQPADTPPIQAPAQGSGPTGAASRAALLFLAGLSAALLTGCGSLDPSGVYQGDKVLYSADLALGSSYDVLHGFVEWEYQNRSTLTNTPAIRHAADQVRTSAPGWFGTALALRAAYHDNPTSANQTALQQALAVVQAAVTQAVGYMTVSNSPSAASATQIAPSVAQ